MIWADAKGYVARKNVTFKFEDLQKLLAEAFSQITPDKWKACVRHVVETVEPDMWRLDGIVDVLVQPMVIPFGDSDSDDDIMNDGI